MAFTIQNRARHLLVLPLNSGGTLHLAPGETSAPIEGFEIENNEKVERLSGDGLIAVNEPGAEPPAGGGDTGAPGAAPPAGVEERRRGSRRN